MRRDNQPPTLMVVHAHPDDEVFSTGGTLATCAERGIRTVVVYATRGEEGELHGGLTPAHRPRLGQIRQIEVERACAELGVDHVAFLGYRDSGMAGAVANQDPRSFWQASLEEAVWRLLALVVRYRPDVLITYDAQGGYGHPDHLTAHRVTRETWRLARGKLWGPAGFYTIAPNPEGFHRTLEALDERYRTPEVVAEVARASNLHPDAVERAVRGGSRRARERVARVDVRGYGLRKRRALAQHRSQIPPNYFYLQLPDELRDRIGPEETFVRVAAGRGAWARGGDLLVDLGLQSFAA